MGCGARPSDIGGAGEFVHRRKLDNEMHDATVALLFIVFVMFPYFLSTATPE
jgi:hypothetical protein